MFPRGSGWTRTGLPAGWLAKRGSKSYDFLAMDGTHLDRKVKAMEFALEKGSREDAELVKTFAFEVNEVKVKKEAVEVKEEMGEQRLRFKGRIEGSQLAGLERAFSQRPYPSQEEREQLAGLLQLPSSVVRNWFQNRRSKGPRPREEVERIEVSRNVTMVRAEPLAVTPPTIPSTAPALGTFSFSFTSRREAYQVLLSGISF